MMLFIVNLPQGSFWDMMGPLGITPVFGASVLSNLLIMGSSFFRGAMNGNSLQGTQRSLDLGAEGFLSVFYPMKKPLSIRAEKRGNSARGSGCGSEISEFARTFTSGREENY
jgi:hypothetical protein